MLELDEITRTFGDKVALDHLTLTVKPGEVVGFLGPNGAGKTTAMRATLGILKLDSGMVRWNGREATLDDRLQFGYMPEERGLYNSMRIDEQLVFLGRLHGMQTDAAQKATRHWLETLGLEARGTERLDSLSLGNQQRVQMAAALVHSPSLLVLDEPFSGLDPTGTESLSKVLKQRADDGAAVIFSSHQLDLVEDLCERVVIVNAGQKIVEGTVEELTVSDRMLGVRVASDPDGEWAKALPNIEFHGVDHGLARIHVNDGTSTDYVLDAARQAGTVTHFGFERRHLSELFREAVAK